MAKLAETRPIFLTKWYVITLWVPSASTKIVAECQAPKISGGLCRPPLPTVARSLVTLFKPKYVTIINDNIVLHYVCRENTLHELQQKSASLSSSERSVVTHLDPDAPIRENKPLADLDKVCYNVINSFSAITITELRSRIFRGLFTQMVVHYIRFK